MLAGPSRALVVVSKKVTTITGLSHADSSLSPPRAQHIWMTDSKGLITRKRQDGDHLPKHKQEMARADDPPLKSLKEVIAHAKPHALIGLSGAGPSWNKARAALPPARRRLLHALPF